MLWAARRPLASCLHLAPALPGVFLGEHLERRVTRRYPRCPFEVAPEGRAGFLGRQQVLAGCWTRSRMRKWRHTGGAVFGAGCVASSVHVHERTNGLLVMEMGERASWLVTMEMGKGLRGLPKDGLTWRRKATRVSCLERFSRAAEHKRTRERLDSSARVLLSSASAVYVCRFPRSEEQSSYLVAIRCSACLQSANLRPDP